MEQTQSRALALDDGARIGALRFRVDAESPFLAETTGKLPPLIRLGALLQALALRLFLIPANLVSGGVSGIAQIINFYTGWPIGVMVFVGNIPLFALGWRFLGGRRFAIRTGLAIILRYPITLRQPFTSAASSAGVTTPA